MTNDGNLRESGERAGAPRRAIDWELVEREYRAGQLSIREIGKLCEVSHVAIVKRARKDGWTRDLAGKVLRRANELLALPEAPSPDPVQLEKAIEEAATRHVDIVTAHRKQIGKAREVLQKALEDLGAADNDQPVATRAAVLQTLSNALKNLIALERQAFNMDAVEPEKPLASENLTPERRKAALALLLAREDPAVIAAGAR